VFLDCGTVVAELSLEMLLGLQTALQNSNSGKEQLSIAEGELNGGQRIQVRWLIGMAFDNDEHCELCHNHVGIPCTVFRPLPPFPSVGQDVILKRC